MKNNPFTLSFGIEPLSYIARGVEVQDIIDAFRENNPTYRVCMITGVRGSGKTVTMNYVAQTLENEKDFITIYLNCESDDLLVSLASQLSSQKSTYQIFKDAKINLSFLGIGIEIDGIPPITSYETAIDQMLESLTKKKKKLLLVIDEVVSSKSMRKFVSQFQIYLGKKYNIFLLMTGLYENIEDLQNEKTLTFLYRAPKVNLKPLNIALITSNYQKIFNIKEDKALAMAKLTKGYPFAYQVLGYLWFKNDESYEKVLPEYDAYLEDYVYTKIWSELSYTDKKVLTNMACMNLSKIKDIRDSIGMNSNTFNTYKNRLVKKGILASDSRGYLQFVLPRFEQFILRNI